MLNFGATRQNLTKTHRFFQKNHHNPNFASKKTIFLLLGIKILIAYASLMHFKPNLGSNPNPNCDKILLIYVFTNILKTLLYRENVGICGFSIILR